MIQIKRNNLSNISLQWWGKVNPILKQKKKIENTNPKQYQIYFDNSVIEKLKRKSTQLDGVGEFCAYLLDESNNYSLLKKIIYGNVQELSKLIEDIERKIKELDIEIKYDKKNGKDAFEHIFNYGRVIENEGYWLAQELNVKVCPYCNRQYTFTIGDGKDKGTRPEFDHFFDKATYPYLALSFYNLVPSCHICNSNLKGSNEFNLKDNIHPYIEGFDGGDDAIKFKIVFKDKTEFDDKIKDPKFGISFFYGKLEGFDIKIKVEDNPPNSLKDRQKRANKNIEIFRIEDLYSQHKDYVVELVQKAQIFDKQHIENLNNQFPNLFRGVEDAQRMILSNYISEDDLDKRPLAKLTCDISEELGLL